MKINLLVTGQIRSPEAFSCLLDGLKNASDHIAELVFSSWGEEIERMKSAGIEALNPSTVSVAPLPVVSVINNRDVNSYLAQRSQIFFGLRQFKEARHTVRLRADHNFGTPEQVHEFLQLLVTTWEEEIFSGRTIVSGVDDNCPYFFEDRVLALAPVHAQRLANSTMNQIWECDYFNIFPEFQFYSTLMDGQDTFFARHDHRYKIRAGLSGAYSDYDYAAFGDAYREHVLRYFANVSDNIVFLKDAAVALGQSERYEALCGSGAVPRHFRVDNYDEYWESFKRSSVRYDQGRERGIARTDVSAEKAKYNAMYVRYFSQDYAAVVDMPIKSGPLELSMAELRAVAILLSGNRDDGIFEMNRAVDAGARGFELLYYLLRELAEDGNVERLEYVAELAKTSFAHEERMLAHIEACQKRAVSDENRA